MLSIIYRAYPRISKQPAVEFQSKYEMLGFCLTSLKRALGKVPFEFIFVNDGCDTEQTKLVQDIFGGVAYRYQMLDLGGVGNQASFAAQLELVANTVFDKILILEDDYYIDQRDVLLNLYALDDPSVDYTTFYYPADAEPNSGDMTKRISTAIKGHHIFGEALPSTTLTFFSRKGTLAEDLQYFMSFSAGAHDSSLWLRLTGSFFWFIPKLVRPLFRKNLRLYLSIVKRYLLWMLRLPTRTRNLVFVGGGKTTHLDEDGVNNKFNVLYDIESELEKFRATSNALR